MVGSKQSKELIAQSGTLPQKDLSVIIVSYNTRDLLKECVEALLTSCSSLSLEIIVVDNASGDGSPRVVRSSFPEVKVLENTENIGFSKATNQGIREATGPFHLLLNSDVVVLESCIEMMMDFMKRRPDVGVLGPKIFNLDGSVQEVARSFPRPMNYLFGRRSPLTKLFPNSRFARRYLIMRERDKGDPFEVDWVSGACMMIRSEVIRDVGLLDEEFFMYWEDADYCRRVKTRGWKVYCLPAANVIHDEGSSSGSSNKKLILEFHRSVFRYYLKHHTRSYCNPMTPIAWMLLMARALSVLSYRNSVGLFKSRRTSD